MLNQFSNASHNTSNLNQRPIQQCYIFDQMFDRETATILASLNESPIINENGKFIRIEKVDGLIRETILPINAASATEPIFSS